MKTKNELTIFYTDDDVEDLEFFKEVTDTIGDNLNLVTIPNGKKLIDALHNPPPFPHVVFLDLNMPGINGFDVLTQLRETENLKKLPVIIFSTSSDEHTIMKSMKLGASYFLPKSGSFPSLKKSIEYALNIDWSTFSPTKDNFVYTT